MPLPSETEDLPPEKKKEPCAICGRPSEAKAWGFALCYGERDGSRLGCVTQLWQEMPEENAKEFTTRWVSARKRGAA